MKVSVAFFSPATCPLPLLSPRRSAFDHSLFLKDASCPMQAPMGSQRRTNKTSRALH